jgi:lysozyme
MSRIRLQYGADLPSPTLPWPIAWEGVELIARAERCVLKAYRCPAGVWTIGWGQTEGVQPSHVWTQEQADQDFCDGLASYATRVLALVDGEASPEELAALVSLAWNIGLGALARSSVLRAHKAGNRQAAARAFGLWNKARVNGVLQVLPGLTSRRAAEAALYLSAEQSLQRMPQAVETESSLAASPIARGGVAVAGVGVVDLVATATQEAGPQLAAVTQVTQQARTLVVDTLGVPLEWLLPALLVAVGLGIWHWRRQQRQEGWA